MNASEEQLMLEQGGCMRRRLGGEFAGGEEQDRKEKDFSAEFLKV